MINGLCFLIFPLFKALGSSTVTSSNPPTFGERKLFSSVARLGFAAAHDSPALNVQEANPLPKIGATGDSFGVTGSLLTLLLIVFSTS